MTARFFSRGLVYAVLILCSLIFLIPFYVLLTTSLKPFDEVSIATMWQLPGRIDFSSYQEAFKQLAPNFMNSVYLVVPATLISALLGSLNGYVLSKWKFKGSEWVFTALLFGMFIPYQSILIPL
ncbi:MAG TPA: carbohydrate ABC transporter permease, partial [Bacillales bacterium]|nr:carbohydrate ABC transporter permease [Bacillales bacterium]